MGKRSSRSGSTTRSGTVWKNQPLALYHGTLKRHVKSIKQGIDLSKSRPHLDFGRGFYTTTVLAQAKAWAWQVFRRHGGSPVVVRFEVERDLLSQLQVVCFIRGSIDADDYWSLIKYSRLGNPGHAIQPANDFYDVAVGPVAVRWSRRITLSDSDQYSFHTDPAVALLNDSDQKWFTI